MPNSSLSFPVLQKGNSICLISPSYKADKEDIEKGIKTLESWGLKVESGQHIFKSWGNFAGTDEERKSDLQWALDHKSAAAIVCIRGGYGIGRILPFLNWNGFENHPKWLVGFSDITLLHLKIQQLGFASIHGIMAGRLGLPAFEESSRFKKSFLFGEKKKLSYVLQPVGLNMDLGLVSGKLWGGNLTMIGHALGSGLEKQHGDVVLFLEEVGEAFYRIDRLFWQISQSLELKNKVKALVLGQFTDCPENGFPISLGEMARQAFSGIPVFSGIPAGHGNPNFPLVLGLDAEIKKNGSVFQLNQGL